MNLSRDSLRTQKIYKEKHMYELLRVQNRTSGKEVLQIMLLFVPANLQKLVGDLLCRFGGLCPDLVWAFSQLHDERNILNGGGRGKMCEEIWRLKTPNLQRICQEEAPMM